MEIKEIPISKIKENPYQTRESIEEDPLKVLIKSIRERGLMSPISVMKEGDEFIIICGHRRLKAFKRLKKKTIPAIVKSRNKNNELKVDLVHENLIREDLNPVEKALSIRLLISEIKTTRDDIGRMCSLIGKLKNYKRRGTNPKSKTDSTKGFDENDIFRLDKILKSLGMSENNTIAYLTVLKIPKHMRRHLVFNKRNLDKTGKILMKHVEQLARIQDLEFQEHLFKRCLEGCTVKILQARVNQYVDKREKGEWKGFKKTKYTSSLRTDSDRLELITEDAKAMSKKLRSFRVDTLLRLEETMEADDFKSTMTDLNKEIDLLYNRINEKLEDKGFEPVSPSVEEFEVKVAFTKARKYYRMGFPMKAAKKLNLSKDKTEYLKIKIVEKRNET